MLAILVAVGVIVGDLALTPADSTPWYQLGIGGLALGLVALNHRLNRRARQLRKRAETPGRG